MLVYYWKLSSEKKNLQAFRHLYVLATEARWIQTVDVDTGLPVYAPLEVTVRETEHYAESSFCEVTPCLLPERSIVSLSVWMVSMNEICGILWFVLFNLSFFGSQFSCSVWINFYLIAFGVVYFLLLKQKKASVTL